MNQIVIPSEEGWLLPQRTVIELESSLRPRLHDDAWAIVNGRERLMVRRTCDAMNRFHWLVAIRDKGDKRAWRLPWRKK